MRATIEKWDVEALKREYLLTRVYAISDIAVKLHNTDPSAIVRYGCAFRDLGMEFDVRFTVHIVWTDEWAEVTYQERTWPLPKRARVFYGHDLAAAVFGPFKAEHQRLVDLCVM